MKFPNLPTFLYALQEGRNPWTMSQPEIDKCAEKVENSSVVEELKAQEEDIPPNK
jgi:hypothetical protein